MTLKAAMPLFLVLFAQVASTYPTINRFELDLESFPQGTKPVAIVRTLKLDFTHNLAGIKDRVIPWTKYPQLDDKFELDFNQRVRISYRIPAIFYPIGSTFLTRLLIDNVEDKRFYYVTGWSNLERIHHGQGHVWLPKGFHTIRIQYIVANNVPVQKFGQWGIMSYLQIEYYKLVNIN